jgi:hypothetical protein
MTAPFRYPAESHQRRHAPAGYRKYNSCRPWLRDEFAFRCVFCLIRETWGTLRGQFTLDHFVPTVARPDGVTDYGNLLYCCVTCNAAKADRMLPDPLATLLDGSAWVGPDGTLHTETPAAARLVELLDLNHPRMVEWRSLWIQVVALSRRSDAALYRRIMAYPAELPDLSTLRPPGGNLRPEGIAESHYARRQRGELPETY